MTATATATTPSTARRVAPRPAPRPAAQASARPAGRPTARTAARPASRVRTDAGSASAAAARSSRSTERRSAPAPLRVVEPVPRAFPARAVLSLAVVVVFASLLVSAMAHSTLVAGQARIDDLGAQIRSERKALEQDRLRLAEASSPARLAAEAERIGLVVAETQTWIQPGPGNEPVVTGTESDQSVKPRNSNDSSTNDSSTNDSSTNDSGEPADGSVGERR